MKDTKIIGLTGKARSGKDTAAGFVLEWCEERGLVAERLALADPLKVSAARALGMAASATPEQAIKFCNELKADEGRITVTLPTEPLSPIREYQITGREFLQFYGTESHRGVFGDEFWVEVAEKRMGEMAGNVDVIVLTDVRFDNEAQMVRRHDGQVWEIDRPGAGVQGGLEHTSEAGVSDGFIEFAIANVGDLEDLRAMVGSVCESNLREEN